VEGKDLQLFLHDEVLLKQLDIVRVQDHEYVLHYEDGQFVQLLKAGVYAFWNVLKKQTYLRVDIRQPELPAEVDRSILPKLTAYVQSYEIESFVQLQLILREYVGALKLDELLKRKQEIASFVLSRLREKDKEYGVQFIGAGVKDVILPGDMKEILNTVLLAEMSLLMQSLRY
jgi:hypothetical protein